jgi:hypothetical protein
LARFTRDHEVVIDTDVLQDITIRHYVPALQGAASPIAGVTLRPADSEATNPGISTTAG